MRYISDNKGSKETSPTPKADGKPLPQLAAVAQHAGYGAASLRPSGYGPNFPYTWISTGRGSAYFCILEGLYSKSSFTGLIEGAAFHNGKGNPASRLITKA